MLHRPALLLSSSALVLVTIWPICRASEEATPTSTARSLPLAVDSPASTLRLELELGGAGQLRARLLAGEHRLVDPLILGSLRPEGVRREPPRIELREHVERYRLPHGKASLVERPARVLGIQAGELAVELRLQDDALAFRRSSGADPAALHLPAGSTAWLQEYAEPSHTGPSYEKSYRRLPAGTESRGRSRLGRLLNPLLGTSGLQITGADGWALPALFRTPEGRYLLVSEAGLELGHAGHHLENRGTSYRFAPPPEDQGLAEPDRPLPAPEMGPWRVLIAGDLRAIFASTAITDLSAPGIDNIALQGRVRPGRLAWDWWTHLGTGPPARQRRHVDFAAELGLEFVLVDANWHRWPDAERQVRELIAYGAERGVGIVLWYNSGGPNNRIREGPRDRVHAAETRQAEFAKIALWGAAGVKVDFWHSDRAVRIASYLELLEDAADYGLMVNLHGSTVPRGWRRTYPHLMTYEAVRGAEFYRFPGLSGPSALDHVRSVLIRNVVGAMDYTPIVFDAALDDAGLPWAHSLALGVLFESAWQHLADTADDERRGYRAAMKRFPFLRDVLRRLPAAWDESVLLTGDPDHHAVVARRQGDRWWLAGIHASSSPWRAQIELSAELSAIGCQRQRRALLVRQGSRPDELEVEKVTLGCRFELELPARGGFLAVVDPFDSVLP